MRCVIDLMNYYRYLIWSGLSFAHILKFPQRELAVVLFAVVIFDIITCENYVFKRML